MNPVLYESNTTSFTTNGLGRLTDCILCVVQEVINGVYELEMTYPIDGAHYSLIQEHRILYVPHDDTKAKQPFEIYRISRPINGKVTVNAWHISYRLRKMVCMPFKADSASDAMSGIESNIVGSNPFTFASTGVSTSATMNQTVPVAVKSLMGGMKGSVIDTFGGEWEYDHFVCTLKNRRGIDTNVSIRYGKNLTDIKKTSDVTDLWSGIIPYWAGTKKDGSPTAVWYDGIIYSPARQDYPYDMVITADASADFETEPTQAQLRSWGQSYVSSHAKSAIPTSIGISFIELWQTEEYKNVSALQRLGIGDTVHVYYDKLGVDNTTRIVSYRYNVLLERYDSMTLGNVRASFASAVREDISGIANDIRRSIPSKSFIQRAMDHQTELITGGLGGYVIMSLNANGEPEEILAMDNPDKTQAVNVLRINKNGIGFSKSGYNGPFSTAWTIDGAFNADYITSGIISAVNINGVNISGSNVNGTNINGSNITGSTITTQNSSNSYYKLVMDDGGLTYTDSSDGTESSIEMGKNADLNNQEYSSIAIICGKNSNQSGIVVFPNSILVDTRNISFPVRNVYFESDKIKISTGSLELETQSGTSTGLTKTLYVDGSNGRVLTMKFVHGILVDVSEGSLIGG